MTKRIAESPIYHDTANSLTEASEVNERILGKAQEMVITSGPKTMRMEDLANALGMSKKTLYVYFPGKKAIIEAIISRFVERVASKMKSIIEDDQIEFVERLDRVHETLSKRLSMLSPRILRELERHCPEAYAYLDKMRSRNIPMVFRSIIEQGIKEGYVRAGIDPTFASQAWLQMMHGLMQPRTLDSLNMTMKQVLNTALTTYFRGILTPKGQNAFDRIAQKRGMIPRPDESNE